MTATSVPAAVEEGAALPLGDVLPRVGASLGTIAIFLIMIVTVVDVGARALFARSVPGMIESGEIILVAAAFLGLGYAQRIKAHVSTSFVIEALPPALSRPLRRAGHAVVAAYIGWATVVSATRAWEAFHAGEVRFGLIEIPQWPARLAIALGFALLFVQLLRELVRPDAGLRSGEEPAHD